MEQYIIVHFLKNIFEFLNEFRELYTDTSKSGEGVGISIIKNNTQS